MAYIWETPSTASLRINVSAINGEISGDENAAGTKSVTFGAIDNTAVFQRFIDGGDGTSVQTGVAGLIPLFINYLLGAYYSEPSAKKTLTVGTEEAE